MLLCSFRFERSIHSAVYSPDGHLIAVAVDDPEAWALAGTGLYGLERPSCQTF